MMRMRGLIWIALFLGLSSSGCCWWADKWCPHNTPACYPAAPMYYAPPSNVPNVPCVPCCPPGTTTGYPTTTWQQPVGNPGCR